MDFNKLSLNLYQESAPYRFTKKPNDFHKGYVKMSDWLNELCFYYEKKRQTQEFANANEFKFLVQEHKNKINELKESDYKKGLLKAINEISPLQD